MERCSQHFGTLFFGVCRPWLVKVCAMQEARKYRRSCCVPHCANWTLKEKISLHSFPRDVAKRREWMLRLCIDEPLSRSLRVCSAHFIDNDFFKYPRASTAERKRLKKTAVPSQHLPVTKDDEHAELAPAPTLDASTVLHESDGIRGRLERVSTDSCHQISINLTFLLNTACHKRWC